MNTTKSKPVYLTPQQHLEHKTRLYWRISRYIHHQSEEMFKVGDTLQIIRNTEKDYSPQKLVIKRMQEIKSFVITTDAVRRFA